LSLYDLDVPPLSRIVWKLDTSYNKKLLGEIQRECWLAELKTVSEGIRKCATVHLRSEYFKEDLDFLNSLDLHFLPIRKCKRVQGFAHKFYDPSPNEPYDIYGVVSRDKKYCEDFRRAHETSNDQRIGALLGYPRCCVKFFIENWYKSYDPIWRIALNTPHKLTRKNEAVILDYYPEVNILLRYFGIRAVPHLPCSFACEESKQLGQAFMDFIDRRRELEELLSSPITWNCYKGVAIVETKWFIGVANSMPFKEPHLVIMKGFK